MKTVQTQQFRYTEHPDGHTLVKVEDSGKFLLLDDGYVHSWYETQEKAEQALVQIKLEVEVLGELEASLSAAVKGVFKFGKGLKLSAPVKAELLESACSTLLTQMDDKQEETK